DFRLRIEYRLPDISRVCRYDFTASQLDLPAVQTLEHRPSSLGVSAVTVVAGQRLEQPLAQRCQRSFRRAATEPRLVISRLHDDDPADHARMVRPAILGTKQVIASGLGGFEPD